VNKLGLIAGNGVFPLEVAKAARNRGVRVVAVAHLGETPEELAELADEITWIRVGEIERMIRAFKDGDVREAAMAGGISRARLADSFAPDSRALAMLTRIGRFSDDAVLRGLAGEIEAEGISLIDPVPMLDGVIAGTGILAGPAPTDRQAEDLRIAFGVLEAMGSFDIGQTVAVRDGVVAAVEAVEGTDAALRRAAEVWGKGMVVAKAAKALQDLRFDRPAIGPATLDLLGKIGAAMIGIQAHIAMILERELTLSRACELGITVYGHE
jgi:UDP-2,3-diacylglucosamine hydrolase